MSKWSTQITYKCECEGYYGSTCNKTSIFRLIYNASIDKTTIYHKRHIEDVNSEYKLYELGVYISDQEIYALTQLLNLKAHDINNEELDDKFPSNLK